jgi:DNA-binding ferritin-like protein
MNHLTRRHPDLHADFTLGHLTSLRGEAKAALVTLLTEQLHVGAELVAVVQQVRWKLRSMTYSGVKELFENLDRAGQDYLRLVTQRLSSVDREAANSVLVAHTFDDVGFSDCFAALHERTHSLSRLIGRTQEVLDQAFDTGDYATVNLVSEIVCRANRLIGQVEMNIPAGSPKARRAATSRNGIEAADIWPTGPAIEAGMMFM